MTSALYTLEYTHNVQYASIHEYLHIILIVIIHVKETSYEEEHF